jgi:hypothetical protein
LATTIKIAQYAYISKTVLGYESAITSTYIYPTFTPKPTETRPYEYIHKGIFEENISGVINSIFSSSDKFDQLI